MVPWAMFFASGDSFFLGVALVAVAHLRTLRAAVPARTSPPRWNVALLVTGVLLMAAASTPSLLLLNVLLALALGPLLMASLLKSDSRFCPGRRILTAGLLLFVTAFGVATFIELQVAWRPWPEGAADGLPIYVIGDSLSAANTDPRITAWPDLLREADADVTNLANVGATARSALKQVQQIPSGPCLVLFLIGGNDFLGTTTAAEFDRDLSELLKSAKAPGRVLAMCELPLPPLGHRFGIAQRRRAAEAGAVLLPKRILSKVLAVPGNTVDGIHLSQSGQKTLAQAIAESVPPLSAISPKLANTAARK